MPKITQSAGSRGTLLCEHLLCQCLCAGAEMMLFIYCCQGLVFSTLQIWVNDKEHILQVAMRIETFYSSVWPQELKVSYYSIFHNLLLCYTKPVFLEYKSLLVILWNKAKHLSCQNKTKHNTVSHNFIIAKSDVWSTQANKINKYILNDSIQK